MERCLLQMRDSPLEMLKEISDSDDVLEIAGDYTGNITARGSSYVHSDDCPLRNIDYAY